MLSINKVLIWAAQNMGSDSPTMFFCIIMPAAAPQLFAGVRIGLAHAFVILFAAELMGLQDGLATLMSEGEDAARFDLMLAGIMTFALLGFASDPDSHGDPPPRTARTDDRNRGADPMMTAAAIRRLGQWYSIPLMLQLWQLAVTSGLVESRLLPSLGRVWVALVEDMTSGALPDHTGVTFSRAALGFALAAILGVPFAAAMARSTTVRNLFEPIFFFFGYPIPKIALFQVFTHLFGVGSPSKVAFTCLECLYPIVVTADLASARSPTNILRRVIFPAALLGIFAGLRVALPISFIVVLTEMIGDSRGLGYYIAVSGTRFAFQNVYAAIVGIGVCGFALDRGMLLLRRKRVHWEREETT